MHALHKLAAAHTVEWRSSYFVFLWASLFPTSFGSLRREACLFRDKQRLQCHSSSLSPIHKPWVCVFLFCLRLFFVFCLFFLCHLVILAYVPPLPLLPHFVLWLGFPPYLPLSSSQSTLHLPLFLHRILPNIFLIQIPAGHWSGGE